jgi:hypothetical protein
MNSQEISNSIYAWACQQNFTAPYGVLQGQHVNAKGTKYLSITFGRARTLDATVEIYNRNFMILRTSREVTGQVFRSYQDLKTALSQI